MRFLRDILLTMLLLAGLTVAGSAQAQFGPGVAPHITPTLRAEGGTVAPGGTIAIAFDMKPDKGWHGYWRNPGDAGLPMEVEWTLPQGVKAGDLAYPVPQRLTLAGLMNYVFEGPYALMTVLSVPASMKAGETLPVRAKAKWLACTDKVCVPEQADLSLILTVGANAASVAERARFDGWRMRLARPLDAQATYAAAGGTVRFAIPWPATADIHDPYLYPVDQAALDHAAPQAISRNGDRLIVETKAKGVLPARFEGVLSIGGGRGLAIVATPGAVPAAGAPVGKPEAPAYTATMILLALAGAILGGLILNIMPCVFPILSLKALSLAKAGGDERTARADALAYAGGAILTCVVLGGVLLALRAGGAALGWAFQLQDPRIVLFLLLLVTAISLNLAGLFELGGFGGGGALAGKGGRAGSFWTGVLAAFVATPCTGPFMGAALGAALVLPWIAALAIFAGLGIGLALPFLLLGYVPALRNRLPRPGAWMNRLRAILSVPMFVTALGLAWLLGKQAGISGMTIGVAVALGGGLILWWFGLRQRSGALRPGWIALVGLLIILAAGVFALPQVGEAQERGSLSQDVDESFSEQRLAALRAEGRPVFLYFTADWCLTCKVNEAAAIDRAEVVDAFRAGKVAVMVGDWTNSDPAIGRFLSAQGRSGVPLYLWYAPGKEPQILPQVLTPDLLAGLPKS